jgi:hypothetical protein
MISQALKITGAFSVSIFFLIGWILTVAVSHARALHRLSPFAVSVSGLLNPDFEICLFLILP